MGEEKRRSRGKGWRLRRCGAFSGSKKVEDATHFEVKQSKRVLAILEQIKD